MSTATRKNARAEIPSQVAIPTIPSMDRLVQRLSAEVESAEERVHSLRTEAAKAFADREQRLMRFAIVADRIHAILLPRLNAFTNVNVFKDFSQSVRPELCGPEGRGSPGRTTTVTVPYSDRRPAPMKLSFCVGLDGPIQNAVIDYRLEILPIFIEFDSHDQLIIPLDDFSEEEVVSWIDDRLVGFTRTYFEVYFDHEYQKKSMEMDPVMKISFPKAYAAAQKEYQKRVYYFFTKESLEDFENNPCKYVTAK